MSEKKKTSLRLTQAKDFKWPHAKILIIGQSGAGKTHGATEGFGSEMAYLPFEAQGIAIVRDTAPEAMILSKGNDKPLSSVSELREALAVLQGRTDIDISHIKYLVIDSINEIQWLFKQDIQKRLDAKAKEEGKGKPPFSKAAYGVLRDKMRNVLGALRDLPFTVIMLAKVKEDPKTGAYEFVVDGSISDEIVGYFNASVYFYRVGAVGGEAEYFGISEADSRYPVKPFRNIRRVMHTKVSDWFKAQSDDSINIYPESYSQPSAGGGASEEVEY